VWLAFVCVWPRLFAFRRPCCSACPSSLSVTLYCDTEGRPFLPSLSVNLYLHGLPRVWVWGFWFGFALRRVALLCGVFVHLHLALFPAGGPFLPSLSVNLYLHGKYAKKKKKSVNLCKSIFAWWPLGPSFNPIFLTQAGYNIS
jgi:hypothetical protein